MEFAFIPLKPVKEQEEKRDKMTHIRWRAIQDYKKQHRPFIIGVGNKHSQFSDFSKEEHGEEGQWTLSESRVAWEGKWVDGEETTRYVAWPVQLYSQSFFISNSLMLTFGQVKDQEEIEECIQEGFQFSSKDSNEGSEVRKVTLKVSLKIMGGTKWCRSLRIVEDYTHEVWEDENETGTPDSIPLF
ncbi:hypothetical protein BHE74_00059153 [Ensete ventricosum]|nr:hypothetical protein GW17_00056569 [Ensete ventricosum]RWW35869.1 hypothetical protein BHE74_00059153 [Ensete ventricosum]RZS01381.1 hypothetical protein BHM03_00031225 [Ensete ventricosum]